MKTKHFTGAIPDIVDERDKELDHILSIGEPFDWGRGYDIESDLKIKIPVKNQGKTSSCVGQATATYVWVKNVLEYKHRYGGLTEGMKKYLVDWLISAKAIYSQIFVQQGGAYLRDGVKLIKEWGAVPESSVPFIPQEQDARDTSWKNPTIDKFATLLQAQEYRVIHSPSIDKVAQSIRDNDGLLMGVRGANNGTWRTEFPKVGNFEWGHAIYGGKARLINGKKHIGILNSWGNGVGVDGWQWLSEEWFDKKMIFNPWLLVDKKNEGWLWLIDRKGKPRKLPVLFLKTIIYLLNRGYKKK